ncbi:MAG TPA: LLM class flavin-dependent oxidoreductase [Thermomicrobiales bacterium]|nr:LLM class flavin-dependent oxidoreductase [Thermomicrobiales bacterium]
MARPRITVGMHLPPKPPVVTLRVLAYAARLMRLESLTIWDHVQDLFPASLWDKDFTWLARLSKTPHEMLDYQATLGYLAAYAARLRLGVGVTEAIRRHPVLIAQSMATLAHISRRAPILGIGTGERENVEPYGLSMSYSVSRLEEALQIIRLCWEAEGPVDFEGRFFNLKQATLDLRPPRKRVPRIWVASHGPRMLGLTGKYGDGWLPVLVTEPEDYAARLATIHAAARAAGRNPSAILPAMQAYVVVAPTEREARAMLNAQPIRFIAVLAPAEMWRRHGVAHPFGEGFKGFFDYVPTEHTREQLLDAMAQVPLDALAEVLMWGTPQQVAGRIRAFGEAGLRHANLELASATVSPRAAANSMRAIWQIRRLVNER